MNKKFVKIIYRIGQLLLVFLTAVMSYFFMQLAITGHLNRDYAAMYREIVINQPATIINILMLVILVVTIIALMGDYWWGLAASIILLVVALFVDHQKILSRSEPLLPSDLIMVNQVGGLIKMVHWMSILKLILFIGLMFVGAYFLRKFTKNYWIKNSFTIWGIRAVLVLFGIWAFAFLFQAGNAESAVCKQLNQWGIADDNHNPLNIYRSRGTIIGFAFNVSSNKMAEPHGYSPQAMQKLAQRYRINSEVAPNTDPVNIIYILNESLTSPQTTMDKYPIEEDSPLSYIDNILQDPQTNQASGYMVSPEYGGGTANVEFEANTGFSNYFLRSTPYQDILPKKRSFPSIMRYLKAQGYQCQAYHPYDGAMYQRPEAYRALGISKFSDRSKLHNLHQGKFGEYVSDASTYPNIYRQQKKSRQFSLVVTMQNHMPYLENMGTQSDYHLIDAVNGDATKTQKLQAYFQELHESDQAFKKLVNHFQNSRQKTLIVMYGDHYPGDGLYDNLADETLTVHATPFVMAANFDLPQQNYGYFSPNYMSLWILQQLGYPLTPFYNLLMQLHQEVPVLTQALQMDSNENKYTNLHSKTTAWQKSQVFRDYEMLEYDLTYGKGYAYNYHMFSASNTKQ